MSRWSESLLVIIARQLAKLNKDKEELRKIEYINRSGRIGA